jgi:hypothetical protein
MKVGEFANLYRKSGPWGTRPWGWVLWCLRGIFRNMGGGPSLSWAGRVSNLWNSLACCDRLKMEPGSLWRIQNTALCNDLAV